MIHKFIILISLHYTIFHLLQTTIWHNADYNKSSEIQCTQYYICKQRLHRREFKVHIINWLFCNSAAPPCFNDICEKADCKLFSKVRGLQTHVLHGLLGSMIVNLATLNTATLDPDHLIPRHLIPATLNPDDSWSRGQLIPRQLIPKSVNWKASLEVD